MWLNRELSCRDYGLLAPGVAGRRWPMAPNLAPRESVSVANVRRLELIVDSSYITATCNHSPVKRVRRVAERNWPVA